MSPNKSEKSARAIKPKLLGTSFFRKKDIPIKIFAIPYRTLKIPAALVSPNPALKTNRANNTKDVERKIKKRF
jgi:hypothetical protein